MGKWEEERRSPHALKQPFIKLNEIGATSELSSIHHMTSMAKSTNGTNERQSN